MPADRRAVVRFVAIFLCVFALLVWPWPEALGRAFTTVFSRVANVFVSASSRPMHFEAVPQEMRIPGKDDNSWFMILYVPNGQTGTTAKLALNLRAFAYMSLAVFISLTLASPIWKRDGNRSVLRSRGPLVTLLGGAILGAFIGLSVALPVVAFLGGASLGAVSLGPIASSTINILYRALFYPPGMTYAVPVLVWAFAMWFTAPLVRSPSPC